MPDPDIDPPAGPSGEQAGIKTPWESIDPDEPAQSAPEPKRSNPAKKPRRRAKAPVARHADQPVPSVSAVAKAAETGGVTDDADDVFAVMAFLPDEHFALTEIANPSTGHDDDHTESVQEDADEPMVEIFLDRSENDPSLAADSEKRLTTSAAIIDEDQTGMTENLDDALAEKAFFPDEIVAPLEMDVPAPTVKSESDESARTDVDSALVEFFADMSPEDPIAGNVVEAESVPQPSTITYPSDVFNAAVEPPVAEQQTAIIPEIFATTDDVEVAIEPTANLSNESQIISTPAMIDGPQSAREFSGGRASSSASAHSKTAVEDDHPPINSQASSSASAHSKTAVEDDRPPINSQAPWESHNSTAHADSDKDVAVTADSQNTTIVVAALKPPKTLAPNVVSTSSSHPSAPAEIADHLEAKPVRPPAAPIRYLRPKAGSLIRISAAALPVEFADETELDPEPEFPETSIISGGGWTIPLMCLGIGLIACCVIIPQADLNRRLYYQRQALASDLESIQKQVAVNDEFLKEVIDNPTLAERLASRQMKTIRKGQKVLAVRQVNDDGDMSPFALVAVPRPPAPTPYKPVIGTIANLCNNARSRLYLLGVSMTMVAVGLVLGFSPKRE